MTTITISLAGSAILPGSPSKTYTVSDADLQHILDWASVVFTSRLPPTPTNPQILLAWIQEWVDRTVIEIQRHNTPRPIVPPPINIQ